jgi:hypothetical protein
MLKPEPDMLLQMTGTIITMHLSGEKRREEQSRAEKRRNRKREKREKREKRREEQSGPTERYPIRNSIAGKHLCNYI